MIPDMNLLPGTSVPALLACSSLTTIFAAADPDALRHKDLSLPGDRPSTFRKDNGTTTKYRQLRQTQSPQVGNSLRRLFRYSSRVICPFMPLSLSAPPPTGPNKQQLLYAKPEIIKKYWLSVTWAAIYHRTKNAGISIAHAGQCDFVFHIFRFYLIS